MIFPQKTLLLINPWIFDFAAYDLWSKPLGLLYLASFLRKQGFHIEYIDCLDKYAETNFPKIKRYGIGNFRREIVAKPKILSHIQRHYARYGMSEDIFRKILKEIAAPDAILITSMMTYWYLGPQRVSEIVRQMFPKVPIILGGIYATLLPEHAKQVIQPDFIVEGPGEEKLLAILADLFKINPGTFHLADSIDDYPYPAFDLVSHPNYLIVMTSRGCPFNCTFCAQKQISMAFIQRNPDKVVQEVIYQFRKFRIRDFAFYDDALFVNPNRHIKVILKKIIELDIPVRFHTPNGLFASMIDAELAELMYRAGFKTIRLSFETVNENRRQDMAGKISNIGIKTAVNHLVNAGYDPGDLAAYVIMGLPDQQLDEIISSIFFVNNLGVQVKLASYSPIPGTKDFQRALNKGILSNDMDPLLSNNSIFPLVSSSTEFEAYRKLRILAQMLNATTKKHIIPSTVKPIESILKSIPKRIQ